MLYRVHKRAYADKQGESVRKAEGATEILQHLLCVGVKWDSFTSWQSINQYCSLVASFGEEHEMEHDIKEEGYMMEVEGGYVIT